MEEQINSIKDEIESMLESLDPDDSNSVKLSGLLDNLLRTQSLMDDDSYSVVFISPPGVGKTTAICHLLDLKDENGDLCLSTSAGRTTVCETEIRKSENTELKLEPIREEEIHHYLDAFVEKIKHSCTDTEDTDNVASPLPAEVERCIRNFTGLRAKAIKKNKEGLRSERPDEAVELFQNECKRDENFFRNKCLALINLESRNTISLVCNNENEMAWLKKTFHEINLGKNPETSIPAKVIVGIKRSLLQDLESDVSIIDTMGIDGYARKDIDIRLNDPRSVIVLCTRFNDAPEEAVRKLLEHIKDSNWHRSVFPRCLILVLERNGESEEVIDGEGEKVGDVDEGRYIKQLQIIDNLRQINDQEFKIVFYDSQIDPIGDLNRELLENISSFKISSQEQIREIGNAVKEIARRGEDKKVKTAEKLLFELYKAWLGKCQVTKADFDKFYKPMLSHMNGPLHASTLRGSVNRSGSFINYNFYYALESEARKKAVSLYQDHIYKLISTLENVRETESFRPVSSYIKLLHKEADEQLNEIADLAAKMGREIYEEFLKSDEAFWKNQRNEWGKGIGYKHRVVVRTDNWLGEQNIEDSNINREIDKRWKKFLKKMDSFLNQNGH